MNVSQEPMPDAADEHQAKEHKTVSVLIPVYNDKERLRICLTALEDQTYPSEFYQVVVADNASTDDIKGVVSDFKQAVYCYEAKQGSYAARNKGLTIAAGEVIAFTDSDCIPAKNWIENGVLSLESKSNCGLIGGSVTLFYKKPGRPNSVELYEGVTAFPQRHYIEEDNFGVTANVFTYRSVIDAVGDFDAELKSGGDKEWGKRVSAAGYQLYYASDVQVSHPARASYAEMYSKTVRVMSGMPGFREQAKIPLSRILKQFLGGLKPPFARIRQLLGEAQGHGFFQKARITAVILFIHYVWVTERARLALKKH